MHYSSHGLHPEIEEIIEGAFRNHVVKDHLDCCGVVFRAGSYNQGAEVFILADVSLTVLGELVIKGVKKEGIVVDVSIPKVHGREARGLVSLDRWQGFFLLGWG